MVVIGGFNVGPRPATITTKKEMVGVMVQEVEVGLKILSTLSCSMLEKVFMALVEVDLGLVPALLSPIIQLILIDHKVFIVTVIKEVEIGLTPANFLHITMGD